MNGYCFHFSDFTIRKFQLLCLIHLIVSACCLDSIIHSTSLIWGVPRVGCFCSQVRCHYLCKGTPWVYLTTNQMLLVLHRCDQKGRKCDSHVGNTGFIRSYFSRTSLRWKVWGGDFNASHKIIPNYYQHRFSRCISCWRFCSAGRTGDSKCSSNILPCYSLPDGISRTEIRQYDKTSVTHKYLPVTLYFFSLAQIVA